MNEWISLEKYWGDRKVIFKRQKSFSTLGSRRFHVVFPYSWHLGFLCCVLSTFFIFVIFSCKTLFHTTQISSFHINCEAAIMALFWLPSHPRSCVCNSCNHTLLFFRPARTRCPTLAPACVLQRRQSAGKSQEGAESLMATLLMKQMKDKHKSFWDF